MQHALKYLSRLQQMDQHRLCYAAFQADAVQGLGWLTGLKQVLLSHGVRVHRNHAEIDVTAASRALKDACILEVMSPDSCSHLQSTYYSVKTHFRCEPYIQECRTGRTRSALARFRTGSHWLQVCMGRRRGVDYAHRRCPVCTSCIEDEAHAIFVCKSYAFQRLLYHDLFSVDHECSLQSFLLSNSAIRVAQFLHACCLQRHLGDVDVDLGSEVSLQFDDYESE